MISICFVCLGNICRSPTAEAVFRHHVESAGLKHKIRIDSAGTGDWHVGRPPDARSSAAALAHHIKLEGMARQFIASDFSNFDYVVAMDRSNQQALRNLAPDDTARAKISLLRSYTVAASDADIDVPDPYYGGSDGFETVFAICDKACLALLHRLRQLHDL